MIIYNIWLKNYGYNIININFKYIVWDKYYFKLWVDKNF